MTPEEFTAEMLNLQDAKDKEDRHRAMDRLMCELLCHLGYSDGIEVFEKTSKWYA